MRTDKEESPADAAEAADYEKEEREAIREESNGPEGSGKPRKPARQRKARAKGKASGPNLVGWFLEAYRLKKGEDGKLLPQYPPTVFELTKSKNLKQAMAQYQRVAEETPEKIADCYCRILQVHRDFRTRVRQVVDIL